ncbi:hypothetical protein ACTZNL_24750 [Klebsiella pneumoniae]|uniref:hypothetical protein n=2 Tax=Klebsiella pneumoniae TaxID=573 RepID=UPI000808EF4B|nr:hypothetical protein [Klebsiella pneumoniae]SBX11508.1 flagellar biosynthesis, cell-distal portion of basal-body rod [Klebsiella pneumoniae]SBX15585.1 flagellar biosynthesis, cell-distal portion of basal-body rod [Klebsiella pneumoniae]SSM28172.1 flagellar biosynthesis, cell-distal portion of basal-body rod [Klebsiella pneumoniae]HBS9986696.1 hypothetical protein [Klebsiella pneumoniae]HBS9998556.1 hypothetical protein [Klebsiella pneumoniae]
MSEYDTGNPVPSASMPDAWDNMQSIDKFVNSSDETITTRTGEQLDTLHGVNVKADNQLTQQQADFETSQEERDAVVEETRQNLIPLSRQYMTLAAAQADIANIPEGSTTYYRSPDDSALAIEVINNGGTLEPTGRKMPSYDMVIQAVLAEFMERSSIIFEGENSSLLSLCDYFGYEVGKVTENSFETRKVKIVQMDSGPGFMLVDDFGNAVDVLSERFTLVAGNNELTDSESLLSFPDEFGNELILVDSKGRQRVGDNLIFDAPDWAQCTTDQFGFVIFGYKLDGTFVGKDNGGSGGEPVPSILETGSVDHWLFGYPDTSMVGRVHGRILSPQSTPEFNKNYVSLSAWGGALVTDIPDAGEYTVCAVVRIPVQSPQSDCVVVYGTQNGYSPRDDDDTYTGNQISLFSDRDDRRWVRSKTSGYRATSRRYPFDQTPVDKWLFISHVVKLTGSGHRYQVISISGEYYQVLREADTDRLILSGRNIAIGNAYCDVSMFKTKGLDVAEFIYFDSALSMQDVNTVYLNSRQRMAERAINLQ